MLVLISVLMPSYNHGKYISEAIDSILNQTFKNFELIITDDKSKDNSKSIIEKYQKEDPRIKAFFHEKNLGIARTLNEMVSKASGKYVAYVSSDDIWDKSKLEKQLAILNKNDSLAVWTEGEVIDKNGVPTGKTFTQVHLCSSRKKSGDIFEELIYSNYIFVSSLIHKKEYAESTQFDEDLKYLNDYKFMVNLARKYAYFFIKEPLTKYRIHRKNTVLVDERGYIKDRIVLVNYFLQEYGEQISKKTKASLYFYLFQNYYLLKRKTQAKLFLFKALRNNWLFYQFVYALNNCKDRLVFLNSLFYDLIIK